MIIFLCISCAFKAHDEHSLHSHMYTSFITDLFKHEFSQSPDLLAILGVIHNVVLHEEGLRGDKMQNICYVHTGS